jgi:hypothetical protein
LHLHQGFPERPPFFDRWRGTQRGTFIAISASISRSVAMLYGRRLAPVIARTSPLTAHRMENIAAVEIAAGIAAARKI